MSTNVSGNAKSALHHAQNLAQNESQNAANALTPGSTRKAVHAQAAVYGYLGSGVKSPAPEREVSESMILQERDLTSKVYNHGEKSLFLNDLQGMFGNPNEDISFYSQIQKIHEAFQQCIQDPSSVEHQSHIIDQIDIALRTVSHYGTTIQDLRKKADIQIAHDIKLLNTDLEVVAKENSLIAEGKAMGKAIGDHEDKRDEAIRRIAQLIDIQTVQNENGTQYLYTKGNGLPLVDTRARVFTFEPTLNMSALSTYADPGPTTINYITTPDETGANVNVTQEMVGGKIGARIEMRDTRLPGMQQQLDAFMTQFRDTLNALHNRGTSFATPTTLTSTRHTMAPGDAFNGTGTVRFAIVQKNTNQGTLVNGTFDLDLTTVATVGALQGALNAGLNGLNGTATATLNADGNLVLNTGNAAHGLAITSTVTGQATGVETGTGREFSHYFGLNDLLRAQDLNGNTIQNDATAQGITQGLQVRSDLASDPKMISHGMLINDAVVPVNGHGIYNADNTITQALAATFEASHSFTAITNMPALTTTFVDYLAHFTEQYTSDKRDNDALLNVHTSGLTDIERSLSQTSGITHEMVLSRMKEIQEYSAVNVKVLQVNQKMIEAILTL